MSGTVLGTTTNTGYLYDGDGNRVAKGTITAMSCDPATSGFQMTESYVLGPSGEELTQFSLAAGVATWQRTNVYVAGKLLATYDTTGLHFHVTDPLGTRRLQVGGNLGGAYLVPSIGQPETLFQSLPYGDGLATLTDQDAPASADDATPLHFTGKERDSETENDYFGARYYASTMARFMSPDWSATAEPVPYAMMGNPQSLNLFAYVGNNPLVRADADGHDYRIDASSGCFTEMAFHNMNGPNCHAVHSPTPLHGPVAGGSETDLALTRYLESGTIPWLDSEGNLKTWVPGYEVLDGPYVEGHWESSGSGASELELAQAPNNGGDYNGNSPNYFLRKPTGQCATALNSYESAADKVNAKGWVGFWGPTMTGAAAGGGGLLSMGKALLLGILNGAAWSGVTDDSRSQINSLYNSANAQWQAAGCGSSMHNTYD